MMPDTMIAGADEHQQVEPLAVEHPADERDQRNAQEVERDHDDRVGDAQRVGEAIVRRRCRRSAMPNAQIHCSPASRSGNSGSDADQPPCTICITFIQNRIAIVLCTGISFLVAMLDTA